MVRLKAFSQLALYPARTVLVLLVAVLVLQNATPVSAQHFERRVPVVEDAELLFRQGVKAFEEGDYGMAYRRFRLLNQIHELNRKTTAALLMAGKALYRDGQYERSIEVLTELQRTYPTSSYLEEARRTIDLAEQRLSGDAAGRVVALGIALPLNGQEQLTQALFNGIRLAVEEYNYRPDRQATFRMVFRDTRNDRRRAGEAITALADEGAEAVIGPLFSAEANAAGAAAEKAGVVLVAPLATDETVSGERRFVFQANPTMSVRGRRMAQVALEKWRLRTIGILAQSGETESELMARAFRREASERGAEILFSEQLSGSRAWADLSARLPTELLRRADALYIPLAGPNGAEAAQAAARSLESEAASLRILGNKLWHDVNPSGFRTTYTTDFYINESRPQVAAFIESYRALSGREPRGEESRLAFAGYDVTRFLLEQLARPGGGQSLSDRLRAAPLFEGLSTRIHFDGGNVNQALFLLDDDGGRIRLVE